MIEVNWGTPLAVTSPDGDVRHITTAEQARYWLRKNWPVADLARQRALSQVEAAMECMTPMGTARRAFMLAARTAGLLPERHSDRHVALPRIAA